MRKLMKIIINIIIMLLMCFFCGNVYAADEKYTANTTINGISVEWEYELNDNNQIIGLVCTNADEFSGKMTIPSAIDGKTVVEIGISALENASQITEIEIPNTVTNIEPNAFAGTGISEIKIPDVAIELSYSVFKGCANLSKVDLGGTTSIGVDTFKDCPKLTSITIPKTLENGPTLSGRGPFTGTTKLTTVTFEEGITKIASRILQDCTDIKTITIPSSVKEIDNDAFNNTGISEIEIPDVAIELSYSVFEGCANLSKVDLGGATSIGGDAFKDCPKLTSITIPKTLENGPTLSGKGPFTGTTKLTSVTFEEGMTKIASRILQDCTEIKTITIPSSVKEIDNDAFNNTGISEIEIPDVAIELSYSVFEGCANLSKVDLGGTTSIGANTFKDCPKLTSITIPKTLENGPTLSGEGPFTGTTKLTSVAFEEGMTKIASRILQDCTEIKTITIPSSVKEIDNDAFNNTSIKEISLPEGLENITYGAFENCEELEKITIFDNVKIMGSGGENDTVFANHNENLTIYCYEDSIAAQYAIKYNIKYSYLQRETNDNLNDNNSNNNDQSNPSDSETNNDNNSNNQSNSEGDNDTSIDDTLVSGNIPNAGFRIEIMVAILIVSVIALLTYKKIMKYKDI